MAVSVLDPQTALIVIDLQQGIVAYPAAHPIDGVIQNAVALIEAFRRKELPVVLVNVDGAPGGRTEQSRAPRTFPDGWSALIPELNVQPGDHLVTKRARGAFTHTDLEAYLRAKGATQVVIVGVSTTAGVESTARQAFDLGFNVTLAVDAMTDSDPDAHHNSITRIFPRLAETGPTAAIITLLEQHEG
jgi:nicotinamidase-related amidase